MRTTDSNRVLDPSLAGAFRFLKTWRLWAVVAVIAMPLLVWSVATGTLSRFLLTGHLFPVDRIDRLNAAKAVAGWSEDGIRLLDGQVVPLPGVKRLPAASKVLDVALEQGIEVASDGRVYGLVRVHHWCGNDPVRNHVARVDVGHLLVYLREAQADRPLPEEMLERGDGFSYSEYGWNISQYVGFTAFENIPGSSGYAAADGTGSAVVLKARFEDRPGRPSRCDTAG